MEPANTPHHTDKNNPEVLIRAEKCTGCLNCQLICSFTYTDTFNPAEAMIRIEGEDQKTIRYTADCTQCQLCTQYCVFGTIVPTKGEE